MPTHWEVALSDPPVPSWCAGATPVEAFAKDFGARLGTKFDGYFDFEQSSIDHYRLFWRTVLETSDLDWSGDASEVCVGDDIEQATFFPHIQLNYAANLLSNRFDDEAIALTAIGQDFYAENISRGELRARVERLAAGLNDLGVGSGDCVAVIARNGTEAILTALAVAALGGIFSSAAPDAGADAIIDRFSQVAPRVLLANLASNEHDIGMTVAEKVAQCVRALPSLEYFVAFDGDASSVPVSIPRYDLSDVMAHAPLPMAEWDQFDFNHPLFIMFSSGTTGRPKCMVHGAGGTLLEHVKEHRLHCDLTHDDSMYFQASCSWMMWNWQLSALASGVRIVVYSGAIDMPDRLWTIARDHKVSVFGASPSYFRMCQDMGTEPAKTHDLGDLRTILSTGSILYDDQFRWLRQYVKDIPIHSISGGTDIIGCFVLGSGRLDIHDGESPCRSLGMDVRALGASGLDEIGDLVCANPFPSRPLYFHGDSDGSRFHNSYFAANQGYWTHGDLISQSVRSGYRMHGRSDGMLNIRGIRVGPAEIYKVVRAFPQVKDVMAVEQHLPDADGAMNLVLLIVPTAGCSVDAELSMQIRRRLVDTCSAAHVPNVIIEASALPMTFSGKQSETAMADAINGRPIRNLSAISNPHVLEEILSRLPVPSKQAFREAQKFAANDPSAVEDFLTVRWGELLNIFPVGRNDNFFDLGGSSLTAARLFADLKEATGLKLPLSAMLQAPTIADLMTVIATGTVKPQPITLLRAGSADRPFFMIHSFAANVLELWPLGKWLEVDRAVYAIEAMGLDGGPTSRTVEEMAGSYISLIRAVQPHGPYDLGGYSFGGTIAFEIARQLDQMGEAVERLIMLDSAFDPRYLPIIRRVPHWIRRSNRIIRSTFSRPPKAAWIELKRGLTVRLDRTARALKLRSEDQQFIEAHLLDLSPQLSRVREAIRLAATHYRPPRYSADILYLKSAEVGDFDAVDGWRRITNSRLTIYPVPGDHYTMMTDPENAKVTTRTLDRLLAASL